MYLKEIEIQNYGAIENMKYSFPFDETGNPLPVILIGKNGSGKTLVLSNILHSLIENKRHFYNVLEEVSSTNYYRLGSKHYIRSGKNHSYERITFSDNSEYVDLMIYNYETFIDNCHRADFPNVDFDNRKLKDDGFFNKMSYSADNVFAKELFLYFPVDRYYIPTWENSQNDKLQFVIDDNNYLGHSTHNIVQYNLLNNIEAWILDVIIDKMLYEEKDICITNTSGEIEHRKIYNGKNSKIQTMLNQLLSHIFKSYDYKSFRFGISDKTYRKIVVIGIKNDGSEEELVDKFSNLSSGEIMILGIFATILKEYDRISGNTAMDFKNVQGIVLIDEIDIHLHSDLVKDSLPALIKIFPKIQFIISSHSPFFLLGMRETFSQNCQFVALPTGTIMDNIDYFDEIKNCYSIIDENYINILNTLEQYKTKFESISRTLIITEGKTDWKHLKNALIKFQNRGDYSNLDLDYLEYSEDLGDSKLENLLKNLAKVPHSNKIIGVFDNDSSIGQTYINPVSFGNNVYGCSIKDTQGFNCPISIEMLYSRDDITRLDKNGRRIYLSDEFTEKSHQLKENTSIVCNNKTLIDAQKKRTIKIVDKEVFNNNENSLALSKEQFAENILNNVDNFANVNIIGFKNIFDVISSIIAMP